MTSILRDTRVLVVEDEQYWADTLIGPLKKRHAKVDHVREKTQAIGLLYANDYDAVILDSNLVDNALAGVEILEMYKSGTLPNGRRRPPMIMVTQFTNIEVMLRSQRANVDEFLFKRETDNYGELVATLIEKWVARGRSARALGRDFVTASPSMRAIYDRLRAHAKSDELILLTGESGVGKNVVANVIHKLHPQRQKKSPVKVECPAIPSHLFESEIFGTCKGAFNDAIDRKGKAKLADGTVLFLDEIGELSLDHQARLLDFIETKEFWPVGAKEPDKTDAKIVAATNANLEERVADGRFRRDLFHRLMRGMHIHIPPLRERPEDIEALADQYRLKANYEKGRNVKGFHRDALALLRKHPWLGNIRELETEIEHAVEADQDNIIGLDDLARLASVPASSARTANRRSELEPRLRTLIGSAAEPTAFYEVMKQMMTRGPKNYSMPRDTASKATMCAAIEDLKGRGQTVRVIAENLGVREQTIRNTVKGCVGVSQ